MLAAGALVNQQDNYGMTPLHRAARNNAGKAIPLLIDAGALVHQQDNYDWTPLHQAAWSDADKVIPLLIDAGALVNQQNHAGWTPLHWAACNNADKVIPLLITAVMSTILLSIVFYIPHLSLFTLHSTTRSWRGQTLRRLLSRVTTKHELFLGKV